MTSFTAFWVKVAEVEGGTGVRLHCWRPNCLGDLGRALVPEGSTAPDHMDLWRGTVWDRVHEYWRQSRRADGQFKVAERRHTGGGPLWNHREPSKRHKQSGRDGQVGGLMQLPGARLPTTLRCPSCDDRQMVPSPTLETIKVRGVDRSQSARIR